jgi:hypothetical protein
VAQAAEVAGQADRKTCLNAQHPLQLISQRSNGTISPSRGQVPFEKSVRGYRSRGRGTVQEYEKLGAFYLGRPYDLQAKEAREGLCSMTRGTWSPTLCALE